MNSRTVFSSLVVLTLVLAGCTFSTVSDKGKGRVLIGAPKATTTKALGLSGLPPHAVKPAVKPAVKSKTLGAAARTFNASVHSRSVAHARDLSAWDDIESMSYTITNLSNPSEGTLSDWIDPFYPFVDVYLTPGDTYRIVVDIVPTAAASKTGVSRYGDQADFTVDYYDDTYVNLYAHPTSMLVFHNAVTGSGNQVSLIDPANPSVPLTRAVTGGPVYISGPGDQFFYDPSGNLFYFNQNASSVYLWPDVNAPLDVTTALVASRTGGNLVDSDGSAMDVYLATVCPDPSYTGLLWAVGYNYTSTHWYLYVIDVTGFTPVAYQQSTSYLDTDFAAGQTSPNINPTGIAVDTTVYHDVYVAYWSADATTPYSLRTGLLEYYGGDLYVSQPSSPTFVDADSAVVADLTWQKGLLWALVRPNLNPGAAAINYKGTADLWCFDDYLTPQYSVPTLVAKRYTSMAYTDAVPTNAFYAPFKFAGPLQGTKFYFGNWDYYASTEHLNSLDLDTAGIQDHGSVVSVNNS